MIHSNSILNSCTGIQILVYIAVRVRVGAKARARARVGFRVRGLEPKGAQGSSKGHAKSPEGTQGTPRRTKKARHGFKLREA